MREQRKTVAVSILLLAYLSISALFIAGLVQVTTTRDLSTDPEGLAALDWLAVFVDTGLSPANLLVAQLAMITVVAAITIALSSDTRSSDLSYLDPVEQHWRLIAASVVSALGVAAFTLGLAEVLRSLLIGSSESRLPGILTFFVGSLTLWLSAGIANRQQSRRQFELWKHRSNVMEFVVRLVDFESKLRRFRFCLVTLICYATFAILVIPVMGYAEEMINRDPAFWNFLTFSAAYAFLFSLSGATACMTAFLRVSDPAQSIISWAAGIFLILGTGPFFAAYVFYATPFFKVWWSLSWLCCVFIPILAPALGPRRNLIPMSDRIAARLLWGAVEQRSRRSIDV